ncbi:MAG: PPC domain-containing protein [Longimicrobiales bacterium]
MIGARRSSILAVVAIAVAPLGAAAQANSVLALIPTDGRQLEIGSDVTGALSTSDPLSHDDHYLEAWELRARAGQRATIDVLSDDFDPRVYLIGPGFSETQFADDGAGGCDARLSLTFLEAGTFRVAVSSLSTRETGTYEIRVTDSPGAPPAYDCGEANPEELNALPTEGREALRLGSMQSSRLDAFASTVQDGRPAQAWRLSGSAGQRVSIIMSSEDFDTYLYMTGPGLSEVLSDDDGAGDLDSKIDVTLPTSGPFTIVAAALSSGSSGSYTIRVEAPFDLNDLPTEGRVIDLGQTVNGQLRSTDPLVTDGRRGQAWAFDGVAGQRVVIDLEVDDLDAYLYLIGPGLPEPLQDDDGGEGLNSRLETVLAGSGTYRIVASSLSSGTGAYTLRVTRQ